MSWTKPLLSLLEKYLDRVICVAGAVLGAQGPEFMQQYLQRIGGELDEARRQLESWRQLAASFQLTLGELITRYGSNPDPAVARGGKIVHDLAGRVDELASAEAALRQASGWTRPWALLQHLDWPTAQATWTVFRPALPTTLEGLGYAALGLGLAFTFYHGAVKPIARGLGRLVTRPAVGGNSKLP